MTSITDEIPGNPGKHDADEVIKSCLMQSLQRSVLLLKKEGNLHDILFAKSNFPHSM